MINSVACQPLQARRHRLLEDDMCDDNVPKSEWAETEETPKILFNTTSFLALFREVGVNSRGRQLSRQMFIVSVYSHHQF